MMRATLAAAQEQALLRTLAKRWGNQWKGQQHDKHNGEDATHLLRSISHQGPQFQRKIMSVNSLGRIAR